jgi:putative iron-regulated protein
MKNSLIAFSVAAVLSGPFSLTSHAAAPQALDEFGKQLVLPTYQTLAERTGELTEAVEAAAQSPSAETVEKAREVWKASREPWERSEAFLFGPVDTEGHDPNLDSWPVNVTDLKKVIDPATGPDTLDVDAVNSLDEGARGFHVVEYLLYADAEGNPVSAEKAAELLDAAPRRSAYLVAAAKALEAQSEALLNDYAPDGNNFVGVIAEAGEDSEVYATRGAALSDIVNAMAGIADESSQAKLLEPAEEGDVTLLESRFSGTTLTDVLNNIAGIERAGEIVKPVVQDEALREELAQAIDEYQTRVEAIPAEFNQNPGEALEAVRNASEAGAALRDLIEQKIAPAARNA